MSEEIERRPGQAQQERGINQNRHNQIFTLINYEGQNFRILTNEYNSHDSSIKFWTVFWTAMSIVVLSALIGDAMQARQLVSLIIIGTAGIAMLLVSVFTVFNRKNLARILPVSLVLFTLSLIGYFIIALIGIPVFTYVGLVYMLLDSIASCVLMKKKPIIFAKVLVFIQVIFILLRIDQKIQAQWQSIFIGVIGLLLLFTVIILFSSIFFIANATCYYRRSMRYKNFGVAFLVLSLASCGLSLCIPVLHIFLGLEIWIFCIPAVCVNLITALFLLLSRKHIIVFFSKFEEIKPFNQIISVIQIADQKQLKRRFLVKSQNWCEQKAQKIWKISSTEIPQSQTNIDCQNQGSQKIASQCLVCLSAKAQMVWIECGHLTSCQACFKAMQENKSISCILCKADPVKIFKIRDLESEMNNLEVVKGYSVRIS